jgi:glycosyltransferase involved in cell wall biosynthesis
VLRDHVAKDLRFLCGSSASQSGVEVLASRLAPLAPRTKILALRDSAGRDLAETSVIRGELNEHLSVLATDDPASTFLLALGLPAENIQAQRILEEVLRRQDASALLWERAGHTTATLLAGLVGLERLAMVLTLSEVHIPTIRAIVPDAEIIVLPAAIPDDFFVAATAGLPSPATFAAFVGRSHPSKGAARLARAWIDSVYPETALPLRLFLVDSDPRPQWVPRSSEVVTVHRLSEPAARAKVMREAAAVLFPAAHDHLPQALLESMAAGALCVVTNIDGHAIVVPGSNGLRLAPDLSDLATIIAAALRDPDGYAPVRARASQTCAEAHSRQAAGQVIRFLMGLHG